MPPMPRIAIVGAGIAGLTAALTLRDAGIASAVYEAANRVGGRMHSDATTWGDGLVSEWCGEFIDYDHATMHALIARFGLDTVAPGRESAGQAAPLTYLQGRFVDAEALAADMEALAPILARQYAEAGCPTTYARFTEAGFALDQMSVYEWIERHVVGGHATPIGHYLDGACSGFYGLDTRTQSALNLVYLFGAHASAARASLPRPMWGTSTIAGGNEQLPLAITHHLPEGTLRLGHRLTAVERTGEDEGPLALTFATAAGEARVIADAAILALPFSTLRHVDYQRAGFDARKREAIEQLGYGTISKLFLEFDAPYWFGNGPWPAAHGGFIFTDTELQTLWDASRGLPGATGHLLVDYTSGERGADYAPPTAYTTTADAAVAPVVAGYARDCLRALERLFPGVGAHYTGRAALSYPTADPHLLGSYACWRVGQYTRFAGYEGVAQGAIHFAGEHCSVEFQGYMEGAAREGIRAAREIIAGA